MGPGHSAKKLKSNRRLTPRRGRWEIARPKKKSIKTVRPKFYVCAQAKQKTLLSDLSHKLLLVLLKIAFCFTFNFLLSTCSLFRPPIRLALILALESLAQGGR